MSDPHPQLSDRARRCLERGGRSVAPDDRNSVRTALASAGIVAFPPVVESFVEFGGYQHSVGHGGMFRFYTVHEAIAILNRIGNNTDDPDRFRVLLGEHPTAQFHFLMDGFGRLLADDSLVADSLTQWIESCALKEMVDCWSNAVRMVYPDESAPILSEWADQNFQRFVPACGRTSDWWLHPQLAIRIFEPWGGWSLSQDASRWVWCFASGPAEADDLVKRIRCDTGLVASDVEPWRA